MPTLRELLEQDGFVGEKTASETKTAGADDQSVADLAASLGLFGETKVAEEDKKEDAPAKKEEEKEDEGEKTASIDGLFDSLFPSEAPASEKTAEEKTAAAEEARGARSFEHFADRFDARVEKLASAALQGSAYKDSQPTNHLPNNKVTSGEKINTKSTSVQDEVKAKNDAATVGHFEQKHANVLRKHLLLSQLEDEVPA